MERGLGYDLIVVKKEEDNIYWGIAKGLLVKFPSNKKLKIGQVSFVKHRSVLEKKPSDDSFKEFEEK